MKRVLGHAITALGVLILGVAFWVWITSDYPDISPFKFFGQFESGLLGLLKTQVNWLRVVVIMCPGLLLFQFGRTLAKKNDEDDQHADP